MANGFSNRMGERIKLNVGGKIFETTVSTLRSGGPESLLSVLSSRATEDPSNPIFIDRDPEIFSVLLSLLRSNHLPSTSRKFSNQELADEALYYGIDSILKSAVSPPSFKGIDASLISTVVPSADSIVSSFTPLEDGSLWAAHGGQVSSYDWNLTHSGTIRTHLEDITSIKRVWNEVVVIGSRNAAGLHLYDFAGSRHVGSVHWTDPADPRIFRARIPAISVSNDSIFGSFDCSHKENCILAIDKNTLAVKSEIGRQNGGSAKTMVAGKLIFLPDRGVLVSSAVTAGAFGYSGYIRLWDPRSGDVVWETNEPGSGRSSRFGDSFADVDVDVEGCKLFKICSKSGDLGVADLRNLGDDPWVYLKDKNPSLRNVSGGNRSYGDTVLHCYSKQVFVGRDGGLEVWSRLKEEEPEGEEVVREGSYRRNFVDKVGDSERGIVNQIEGGGNRLFVRREEVEGIEVWESSNFSSAVSIS